MTQLFVIERTAYGTKRIYPACELSKLVCDWLRKKTLSERDLEYIGRLGIGVVRIPKATDKKNWME